MPHTTTYLNYLIAHQQGVVRVYDPRWPDQTEIFQAKTLREARRWIKAYRDGHQWAVAAALPSGWMVGDEFFTNRIDADRAYRRNTKATVTPQY